MHSRIFQCVAAATLAATLTGCGSDSGFDEDADFVTGEGAVQFVNMMPDSMTTTMQHGIQNSLVRFPFAEQVETRFEDSYDWRLIFPNNSNDAVEILEQDNQIITENVLSTFLFMGTIDNPSVSIIDTPVIAEADRPEGLADVWFASNVTYIDMVDVYLTENGADLSTLAPTATVTTQTFTNLIEVPSGESMQLRVTVAGTDQLLFDSGIMTIVDKSQELFAFVDDFGPESSEHIDVIRSLALNRTIMRDASQRGRTRIANYTSTAALDTTFGATSQNDIASTETTAYFESGEGDISYLASDDGTVLEETTLEARLGTFASVYNFDNTAAEPTSTTVGIVAQDVTRDVSRRALLKFINGTDTVVDLYVLRGDQTLDNSSPLINNGGLGAFATAEFVVTNQTMVVRNSEDNQEIVRISESFTEGTSYTLLYTPDQQLVLLQD